MSALPHDGRYENGRRTKKLLFAWALATAAAFGIGGRLATGLSVSKDAISTGYLALGASLIVAGLLQWLMLRGLLGNAGWWAPSSIAAVVLIGLLVFGLGKVDRDVGWVSGVVVGWILLGVFQWLVLREQVAGAGWWIPANALGLVVAIPFVGLVTWISGGPEDGPAGASSRWLAFGGAYGAVTGGALWWLLQERVTLSST